MEVYQCEEERYVWEFEERVPWESGGESSCDVVVVPLPWEHWQLQPISLYSSIDDKPPFVTPRIMPLRRLLVVDATKTWLNSWLMVDGWLMLFVVRNEK
jgi:hypothetical protein